jgi:hypothetical protein
MSETLSLFLFITVLSFAILAILSYPLHRFIGLKSPPTARAAWTVGVSFVLTTNVILAAIAAGLAPVERLLTPIAAVPGALLTFWFWRTAFRRAWIDEDRPLRWHETIEEDDWLVVLVPFLASVLLSLGSVLVSPLFG